MKLFPTKKIVTREDMRTPDPTREPVTRDGAKDHEAAGYKQAGETKDNGALEIFQDDEKLYRAHKGILWEKPKFK